MGNKFLLSSTKSVIVTSSVGQASSIEKLSMVQCTETSNSRLTQCTSVSWQDGRRHATDDPFKISSEGHF